MAQMVHRTLKKGKCTCFLFPRDVGIEKEKLCFRKNFVGALTDSQTEQFCDMGMSKIYSEGREEVSNLVRTIKQFTEGVAKAKKEYWEPPEDEEVLRDMNVWRDKVSKHTMVGARNVEHPDLIVKCNIPPAKRVPPKLVPNVELAELEGWF